MKERLIRSLIITVLLGGILNVCTAQKRYNVWAFGQGGGLNFNTTPPVGFKSKSDPVFPGTYLSSICDPAGNLMFYTDGITVWNRDGFKMPKYNNWWPLAGKVMPLVCPRPGSDTLFWLFAISDAANPFDLQALPLRLRAAGDIDEMVYPRPTGPNNFQKRLKANCSMVLAATAHCNQQDYWVSTYSDHAMQSFLVSDTGICHVPVVSEVAVNVIPGATVNPMMSNLKFSPNSERAVLPDSVSNSAIVFDFDNATGLFINPVAIRIPAGYFLEEVELSPDGSKLYLGVKREESDDFRKMVYHDVAQVDLNAGSVAAIQNSYTIITPIADLETCTRATCFFVYRTMNIGPDGKIYVGMRYATRETIPIDQTFSVIEAPNTAGLDCLYKKMKVNVGMKYMFAGYNYMRSAAYTLKENGITVQKQTCSDKPVQFGLLFSKVDSVRWEFGDAASGSANFSSDFQVQHKYPGPGTYKVKALVYNKCIADTAATVVIIAPDLSVQVPHEVKDTMICVGQTLQLNARNGTSNAYTWDNGLIRPDRTITEAGNYRVMVMNDCSVAVKEFKVGYKTCPCNVFVPTAFTPNKDGLNDEFKPATQCIASEYRFEIYNRFGAKVFSSSQPSHGWNGNIGPHPQAPGVFVWKLQYRDPNTKTIISTKGTVVLLR